MSISHRTSTKAQLTKCLALPRQQGNTNNFPGLPRQSRRMKLCACMLFSMPNEVLNECVAVYGGSGTGGKPSSAMRRVRSTAGGGTIAGAQLSLPHHEAASQASQALGAAEGSLEPWGHNIITPTWPMYCLLYTSDAADE